MVLRSGQSQENQRKPWKSGSCLGASEAMSYSRWGVVSEELHQMLGQVPMYEFLFEHTVRNRGQIGQQQVDDMWFCVSTGRLLSLLAMESIQPRKLEGCYWASANDSSAPAATYCRSAYSNKQYVGSLSIQVVGGKAMCNSPVWQRLDRPFGCKKR